MPLSRVGCVVIGRNEGERLRRCLTSVLGELDPVLYVDSGSTDDSVALATELGAEVVALDPALPFTAGRARNIGFERLIARDPAVELVQFVDGDCEVVPGWLSRARDVLLGSPAIAVACGRRRERYPEASVYNRLCDIEWNTPVGEAASCGGDAMIRASAFAAVGGFNPSVIAGEEPELCVRLRGAGYRIERVDHDMTLHDAAIYRFDQWWRRTVRAGHAFAEGAAMHGAEHGHWIRESRRIWFWGAIVPLSAFGGALPTLGLSLGLLAGYPISASRTYRATRRRGYDSGDALANAAFTTLGKFAELIGATRYHFGRRLGRRSSIIEYKAST